MTRNLENTFRWDRYIVLQGTRGPHDHLCIYSKCLARNQLHFRFSSRTKFLPNKCTLRNNYYFKGALSSAREVFGCIESVKILVILHPVGYMLTDVFRFGCFHSFEEVYSCIDSWCLDELQPVSISQTPPVYLQKTRLSTSQLRWSPDGSWWSWGPHFSVNSKGPCYETSVHIHQLTTKALLALKWKWLQICFGSWNPRLRARGGIICSTHKGHRC